MAMVWVRAGVCEKETTIAVERSDMTHVRVTFDTTCEHVQKLAEALTELDVASEMTRGHLGEHPTQRIAHLSSGDGTSLPQ